MVNETTKLEDLINPQVMADMISGKIPNRLVIAPFAKVDTTLVGRPGDTVTVPQYAYIGDAVDVAEGVAAETVKLSTTTTSVTVKKAMKAVELTDEALLSGYGDPVGETNNQIAKSIASKADNDGVDALYDAQLYFDGSGKVLGYDGIVNAIDVFNEEFNSDKVCFVHPKQVTKLRLDPNFLSADKYQAGVAVRGEVGMIANTRIVTTRKVKNFTDWYKFDEDGALEVVETGGDDAATVDIAKVKPSLAGVEVGDTVTKGTGTVYLNPIIKLNEENETEDDAPALTLYLKRDTNVERERISLARKFNVSADKHYTVALSNTSKVVLAAYKA